MVPSRRLVIGLSTGGWWYRLRASFLFRNFAGLLATVVLGEVSNAVGDGEDWPAARSKSGLNRGRPGSLANLRLVSQLFCRLVSIAIGILSIG